MVLKRPSTTLALKKNSHLCWGFRFLLGLLTWFFWISAYWLFELISWISGWHDLVESLQFGIDGLDVDVWRRWEINIFQGPFYFQICSFTRVDC